MRRRKKHEALALISGDDIINGSTGAAMHKFIIIGNSFLPVNTRAERALAGRAVARQANDTNCDSVTVYHGAHTNADPTGEVLDCDGAMHSTRRLFHGEGD
jgi:hypothetical protein